MHGQLQEKIVKVQSAVANVKCDSMKEDKMSGSDVGVTDVREKKIKLKRNFQVITLNKETIVLNGTNILRR